MVPQLKAKWDEKLEQILPLKIEKFLYLISPNKIKINFYKDLEEVLSSNKIKYFQLRLKNILFQKF